MKFITDEIYRDPDSLRELALSLEFSSRARNFPGRRSTRTVIPGEIRELFASVLKIDIDSERIPYNGCFQSMLGADSKRAYVHADTSARWAGLVYLSDRHEPSGGTSFFRHRETGLLRFPESLDLQALVKKDRMNRSKWEEIDRVGFIYNRALIYDALLFHRNGKTWGSSLKASRLTHNFFY